MKILKPYFLRRLLLKVTAMNLLIISICILQSFITTTESSTLTPSEALAQTAKKQLAQQKNVTITAQGKLMSPENIKGASATKKAISANMMKANSETGNISFSKEPPLIAEPIPLLNQTPQEIAKMPLGDNTLRLIPDYKGKTFRLALQTKAPFKIAIVRHTSGVYVIFDHPYKPELLDLPGLRKIVENLEVIPNPSHLIIKMNLAPFVWTRFDKDSDKGFIQFYHVAASRLTNTMAPSSLLSVESQQWPTVVCSGFSEGTGALLKIENQPYYIFMTDTPDGGFQGVYANSYIAFSHSHQGIGIRLFTYDLQFKINDGAFNIKLPCEDTAPIEEKEEGIFGNVFDIDPSVNINTEKKKLKEKLLDLSLPYPIHLTIKSAWLDLQRNMAYEALGKLSNCKEHYPSVALNPLFKALIGMAYFLTRDTKNAIAMWSLIPPCEEFTVWTKLAQTELGVIDGSKELLSKIPKLLERYGQKLREELVRRTLHVCKMIEDGQTTQIIAENTQIGFSYFMSSFVAIHLAFAYFNMNNYIAMDQVLKKIPINSFKEQPNMLIKSHYDFLTLNNELYKKSLTNLQAYEQLATIRFYWRRDLLEYRILAQMIEIQKEAKNYQEMLRLYKILKRLYPLQAMIELVDPKIQETFTTYTKTYNKKNPLDLVDIYSEFSEYIPDGKTGLEMIETIANGFQHLGLLDEAAEILSRSLKEIPDNALKIQRTFEIADLYAEHKKHDSALALLDSIPFEQVSLDIQNKILTDKAKVFHEQGKFEKIINLLDKSTKPQHILYKSDVYIELKDWDAIIPMLETLLLRLDEKKKEDHQTLKHTLNNLALALAMDTTKSTKALETLQKEAPKDKPVKSKSPASPSAGKSPTKNSPPLSKSMQIAQSQEIADLIKDKIEISTAQKKSETLGKALENLKKAAHKHQRRLDELYQKYNNFMKEEKNFLLLTRPQTVKIDNLSAAEAILKDAEALLAEATK